MPSQRFEFRPGVKGFPPFRGINRQVDPAAIPADQFQHLENVRLVGGQVVSRGGQSKFSSTPLTGCIVGVFGPEFQYGVVVPADSSCGEIGLGGHEDIATEQLYYVSAGDNQTCYYYFSDSQGPKMRKAQYAAVAAYNDYVAFTSDATTVWTGGLDLTAARTIVLRSFTRATRPTVVASVAAVAGDDVPASIAVYGGSTYLSTYGAADATPRIYVLSGSTLNVDDTPGMKRAPHLAVLGTDLYAVWGNFSALDTAGQAKVRRRNAGVWADLVVSLTDFSCMTDPVVYSGTLYALGQDYRAGVGLQGAVLSISGTTVTTVRSGQGAFYRNGVVFDGDLYYIHSNATNIRIGQFDGATWTDNFKDITAQFAGVTHANQALNMSLDVKDGNLRLLAKDDSAGFGCVYNVYTSPGTNVAGTWTAETAHHVQAAFIRTNISAVM